MSNHLRRDAAALFDAMTELLRVYQFRERDRVGYEGLTITQSYTLHLVIDRGRLTLNELAEEMGLDKSTLSRVVDGMEKKRAVKRSTNPVDGRSTFIEATPAGRRRYERVRDNIIAENTRVLSAFSGPVRRKLLELVSAMTLAARARKLTRVTED